MTNDLVSIVIPVDNGEEYLAPAIDSVLSQSYSSVEIIDVDSGSSGTVLTSSNRTRRCATSITLSVGKPLLGTGG